MKGYSGEKEEESEEREGIVERREGIVERRGRAERDEYRGGEESEERKEERGRGGTKCSSMWEWLHGHSASRLVFILFFKLAMTTFHCIEWPASGANHTKKKVCNEP